METRPLGNTGLEVSAIGLGCVTFGREIGEDASFAVLDHAREQGITLLDTAAAYHHGASETVLGDWMADRSCRAEFAVATKVIGPLTRDHIIRSAEESLRRLRVDVIDLFQLHAWDEATPLEETMGALETLRVSGKIRHAGCSNWSASQLIRARQLASSASDLAPLASIQPPYNLVQREIEDDTLALCRDAGIGVLTYSPLAAGFLTGKYQPGGEIPAGARFDVIPGHQPLYFTAAGWRVLEGLARIAKREARSMVSLALGWTFSRPGVTSMLIGARHCGHVDQAIAVARQPPPPALLEELSALD